MPFNKEEFYIDADISGTFKKPEDVDLLLTDALNDEAKIRFKKRSHKERDNLTPRYVCRKRKIIGSGAFKCLMVGLSSLNQYEQVKNYRKSLILEVKRRGINLDFKTGFEEEMEHNSEENGRPQLLVQPSQHINAVDVLICNLPPWYEQIHAYKLLFPLVPDDLLRIDWHRMYAAGSKECSYPYGIVYVKSRRAADILRYGADELVIDSHRITVCLMENLEDILLDVKSDV